MGQIDFDEIRRRNPLEQYCADRGFKLKHTGNFLIGKCLIHGEVNGEAFVVFPDTQRWQCFGKCNKSGDVLDLDVKLRGGTLADAAARLGSPASNGHNQKPQTAPTAATRPARNGSPTS
jgi:DNA primase